MLLNLTEGWSIHMKQIPFKYYSGFNIKGSWMQYSGFNFDGIMFMFHYVYIYFFTVGCAALLGHETNECIYKFCNVCFLVTSHCCIVHVYIGASNAGHQCHCCRCLHHCVSVTKYIKCLMLVITSLVMFAVLWFVAIK